MKRVSFDFDGTFSLPKVRFVAKELIERGFEVWIVTARCENGNNADLDLATKITGVKNIKYMCFEDKAVFLKDKGFIFHLDDDVIELDIIKRHTDVFPICHMDWGSKYGGKDWVKIINELTK